MRHEFLLLAYGTSPYLDACLASLKRQTNPARIRIATSTPNEHVLRIARQYDVEILANPQQGGGIAADWNFALGSANADLFTLAHQDDIYHPAYSETLSAAMERHPDALVGFSDSQEMDAQGRLRESLNDKVKRLLVKRAFGKGEAIRSEADKRRLLSLGNPVCCPAVIFNRPNLGDFRFSPGLKSNLDWDAWLRLSSQSGAFVYHPKALVQRRNHALSETFAVIGSRQRLDEDRAMFERLWPRGVAALLTQLYRLGYVGTRRAAGVRNASGRREARPQ
jgi:hypothetical protein